VFADIGFDVLFDELPGRVPDHPLFLVEVILELNEIQHTQTYGNGTIGIAIQGVT